MALGSGKAEYAKTPPISCGSTVGMPPSACQRYEVRAERELSRCTEQSSPNKGTFAPLQDRHGYP